VGAASGSTQKVRYCYFRGAGTSLANNFPSWKGLVASLARQPEEEVDALMAQGMSLSSQLSILRSRAPDHASWSRSVRNHLYKQLFDQMKEYSDEIKGLNRRDLGSRASDSRKRVI
jgi:hypothetical protein